MFFLNRIKRSILFIVFTEREGVTGSCQVHRAAPEVLPMPTACVEVLTSSDTDLIFNRQKLCPECPNLVVFVLCCVTVYFSLEVEIFQIGNVGSILLVLYSILPWAFFFVSLIGSILNAASSEDFEFCYSAIRFTFGL